MADSTKPNVVFILVDNGGWGDIGCYGGLAPTRGSIIKPQWPLVFDLTDDPDEEWDQIEKRVDKAWVVAPVAQRLRGACAPQQSMTRHRNITPGENFTGYS